MEWMCQKRLLGAMARLCTSARQIFPGMSDLSVRVYDIRRAIVHMFAKGILEVVPEFRICA